MVNVYGGKNQGLRFYAPTGKAVREAPGIGTLASGTMDMFSPSGRTFVTDCPGGGDGDHCLWSSATGKRVRTFTSPCDKVLGWYDETHLYCWEQDDASRDEVQVVDFKGKLVRKLIDIGDDVVGRHHQQRGRSAARRQGRQRDRRGGVARDRFQDHRPGQRARRRQLIVDHVGMGRVGDHDGRVVPLAARPPGGELEHRLLGGERQQLLGPLGPRHGP